MNKDALIVLRFSRPDEIYWLELVKAMTPNHVSESPTMIFANIGVKSYSLADHQFIQVKVILSGKARIILLPRNIVAFIIELPTAPEKDPFRFIGTTTK
jgi:hypothetical protein